MYNSLIVYIVYVTIALTCLNFFTRGGGGGVELWVGFMTFVFYSGHFVFLL